MVDKIREIALKALYKIDKEEAYSNIALNDEIKNNRKNLTDRDVGFISELVYGVTSWKLTIDEIIKKYSNIRLKKISPWILNILRMGVYQIVFLDKVPKSASVNESVNLAKRYGHKSSANFVNAILRKVTKQDYDDFSLINDDVERISKLYSMPVWIIKELLKNNSIEEVQNICKSLNLKPNITIRINKLKITKNDLIKKLNDQKILFNEIDNDDFLALDKVKNIENMDLFKEGYITIQDISAGFTASVLSPLKGEKVLDACSAPGGKTTYMAELMQNEGEIIAWDIHEHRTRLINENAKRLGINIIKTEIKDASVFDENLVEKFDKILLDVPCLGIGVIKRKPDIKWKRKEEDVKEIVNIQKKILETCSKYLKKNGELVYSTCSILQAENDDVINEFLAENLEFECVENCCFNIVPDIEKDGFFICKLIKK